MVLLEFDLGVRVSLMQARERRAVGQGRQWCAGGEINADAGDTRARRNHFGQGSQDLFGGPEVIGCVLQGPIGGQVRAVWQGPIHHAVAVGVNVLANKRSAAGSQKHASGGFRAVIQADQVRFDQISPS